MPANVGGRQIPGAVPMLRLRPGKPDGKGNEEDPLQKNTSAYYITCEP